MIRVTVELVPWGNEDRKYEIAQAEIWNTLDITDKGHTYGYSVTEEDGNPFAIENQGGSVVGHNRNQSVWKLVQAVLGDTFK